MKIIKCMANLIDEELHDAEKYIDLALRWKEEEPDTADLFCSLSADELGHFEKLHTEVQNLIEDYKNEHGEPPKDMMVLYEYLHEKHIALATEIKVKHGIFKA